MATPLPDDLRDQVNVIVVVLVLDAAEPAEMPATSLVRGGPGEVCVYPNRFFLIWWRSMLRSGRTTPVNNLAPRT